MLQEKREKLENDLKRFNLPENLPDGESFLPERLDEDEKAQIIKIQKRLREIKNRQEFLEDSSEIK